LLHQVGIPHYFMRKMHGQTTLNKHIFAKFQSLIRCGIILWGEEIESIKVLKIQKRYFFQLKGLIQESLVYKFNRVKDSPNDHFIYL